LPVKNAARPFNIFNATVSDGQTYTSSNTAITYLDTVGYQINLGGVGPTGVLQINGSNDWNPQLPESANPQGSSQNGTWVTIASVSIGIGSPNPVFFNMNQLGHAYIQCQFVSSTASGTLSGWLVAKSLG